MANQLLNGKKVMQEELIRGHDMAKQLLEVLVHKSNSHDQHGIEEGLIFPLAQDLVHQILISFTNTLLLLNNKGDEVPDIRDFSSSVSCTKPRFMDEDCKNFNAGNRRRGCYKRKLITPTWEKDSSILIEDGHGWRKYGLKMTTKAKYLRNYYKCTHKYDQGCSAIKQVQRIQEDPPLYRTTYFGHHTCKTSYIPDIILEPFSSSGSILLSFNNSLPSKIILLKINYSHQITFCYVTMNLISIIRGISLCYHPRNLFKLTILLGAIWILIALSLQIILFQRRQIKMSDFIL